MIGIRLKVGVQEFVAGWSGAPARGLDGHKDGINFRQNPGLLELEHPAVLPLVVYIEDAQALGWILGWPARAPNLEGGISLCSSPITQVKRIKDQRFSFGIKDTAKSPLVFALAVYVKHVDDMQIASAHQVMDIAARR